MSHLINDFIAAGSWRPISICRGGLLLSHIFFADDVVFFAEASLGQVSVIKRCLDQFCGVSGQKVSFEKSRISFSSNVSSVLAEQISSIVGIPTTSDMGVYLGIPTIYGRITKHTFHKLLDKVWARLATWKAKSLSLAGRITLAQSVLNSIPFYTMQVARIPMCLLNKLDRLCRCFIWGHEANTRSFHPIRWETLCRPKDCGGLGMR